MSSGTFALRAEFLHCLTDPSHDEGAVEHMADGVLHVEDGHVVSLQAHAQAKLPASLPLIERPGRLVVPGFVDTHVHYPQMDVIASHGTQLLDWLNRYTFPAESLFRDAAHARRVASLFLDQLLLNGTTTALVFATVHPQSVDAFFAEARNRRLRMISGKVLMDRNAPDDLRDSPETARADSERLIRDWHGQGRLGYAVTPRFAPTSSDEQLAVASQLLDAHPGVHLHTHLAENAAECDLVHELFPTDSDYLAVYERHGLVRARAVFAHAIHLSHDAWKRLATADASVAHCPMSNLFIGSGLFDLRAADAAGVRTGLGTDVGGGDSYSLLRTLNETYKVQQLQHYSVSPERLFYLATLGGAHALDLDADIGNFLPGKEADFVVLDEHATQLTSRRTSVARHWRDRLFALMMLGDDRNVAETWILGAPAKH